MVVVSGTQFMELRNLNPQWEQTQSLSDSQNSFFLSLL